MHIFKFTFLLLIIFYNSTASAAVGFKINGVEKDAKDNISLFLRELSEPKNADNETYLNQVEQLTYEALNALGYYQVELNTEVSGDIGQQTVTINIVSGVQTRITKLSVKLTGEGQDDPQFKQILESFPLKLNDILHHGDYEKAKNSLINLAQQRGYFDAQYDKSLVEVTSKNNSAVVYLWFNTGVRYQFGELLFDSDLPAEKYIHSLQSFAVGDPFNSQLLSKFNAEINSTGYFRNITILPMVQDKQGLQIPLHVVAKMRPQDSFHVGIGYSTDEGTRGKFRWLRPWVNNQGHSIEANIRASVPEQEISLTYKIPLADPLYDYASIQTGYKRNDNNDTDTNEYLVTFNRHQRLSNNWLRTIFIKYNYETGVQGQQEFSTRLIVPGINFRRTRSRGGINTDWGDSRFVSLEAANDWWLSDSNLIKAYGKAKLLRSYQKHQFVAYAELGAIHANSIYDVPSSMRFFTGGDQSVRGYTYETIAPEDNDGFLLGGLYLAVASLEYRFPISENWKLALFSDAGTATDDFSEDISSSAGLGTVWTSPIGPVRLYLARPFTQNTSSLAVHFMIGPEL